MKRPLIFIQQYFAPEPAGSAQQLTDLALGLQERGYPIQVVTGQPSYSSKQNLPSRENFKGIEIFRVPKIQLARRRALGRILSGTSFFLSAFFKLLSMDRRALLVIGSDPPFLSLMGWFFKKIRNQDYDLIVFDIYPDIAVALGELSPRGVAVWILEFVNRLSFKEARRVITLSGEMAKCLREKFPAAQIENEQLSQNMECAQRYSYRS